MIDTEHTVADKILEEVNETVNVDERDELLIQYQRICQASRDRAESDLSTMDICDRIDRDEKK